MGWRLGCCNWSLASRTFAGGYPPVPLQFPGRYPLEWAATLAVALAGFCVLWADRILDPVSLLHHWRLGISKLAAVLLIFNYQWFACLTAVRSFEFWELYRC
jgi:hypothetical protein